ncbi:ADP-ribosylglycohydrolase family protein [Streptomyces acidiscabies]|uniref:ADP-ribosylglycohydrolase family protein n=1 Tax=Streptomyces acidiscabies TaxID=42234 RepID=A0AAP6B5T4_9ACTN|nr:ADP-ribosylglycohydrolase family protein [Streptomyces acidiscabies]MBP5940257.1 ADP-ribosylglycohydrolase family protein [Streptomyces sp. LBUM 1476]MBZ3911483.1 ADP-ribosylglycohydrolase family protein [Streptomyces acidiscabies]MDX2958707.1 ADP-ribosylglycohydrolase family protein [Streptomyces acidiscabies]MDX3018145.1 ADP-ribosylglycohydrolase family protein [Streptomyces acidiscabies]MDX3791542.1 ADP-ribosylglycohydrolase family protein [Streptomyces acidiscabies]
MLRLTWLQPEDLLAHELRQAREDGRDTREIAARWQKAGGKEAPSRAGASPTPPPPHLRDLATALLAELAAHQGELATAEPTDWPAIQATWPPTNLRGAGNCATSHNEPTLDEAQSPPQTSGARGCIQCATTVARARQATTNPALDHSPKPPPTPRTYESAWLGRAVGCLLGKPVEKLPLPAIRALAKSTGNWPLTTYFTAKGVPNSLLTAHPWNRRSAPTSLAENIDGMPEDDDLNYPLLNLLLLQRHGRNFTTEDVARLWLDELPAGRTFTAERIAYRNLLTGIDPPRTAHHNNPFREWIGAMIRADVHGWTNPGNPRAAAEQAYRDATLTHTANGVYAAMYIAATIATAATGTQDIHTCLATALTLIPPTSRLHKAVEEAIQLARTERDFDRIVDELHATHGHYHWVHAIPNTALIAAALTHADGDFTGSISRTVSGGWDTDSNGATAGSIAALLTGPPPPHWTAPLKNRLSTTIADFDGTGFDTLAHLTHAEAARP